MDPSRAVLPLPDRMRAKQQITLYIHIHVGTEYAKKNPKVAVEESSQTLGNIAA